MAGLPKAAARPWWRYLATISASENGSGGAGGGPRAPPGGGPAPRAAARRRGRDGAPGARPDDEDVGGEVGHQPAPSGASSFSANTTRDFIMRTYWRGTPMRL